MIPERLSAQGPNEDDAPGEDVEAQVDVDTRQNQARQKWHPEILDGRNHLFMI